MKDHIIDQQAPGIDHVVQWCLPAYAPSSLSLLSPPVGRKSPQNSFDDFEVSEALENFVAENNSTFNHQLL